MRPGLAPYCSALSADRGEPLAGTAPAGVTHTLLIPHRGLMASQPIESPGLLVPRTTIEAALETTPGSRFHLFVREAGSAFADSILVARTERDRRDLHRFPSDAAAEPGALAGMLAHPERGEEVPGPLHLVCTHGKRDACCARYGTPLHAAFSSVAPGRVLRSSHLGGHRFAPVVHTFPAGFCFGRVELDEVAALDEAASRGEVHDASRLRGVFPYDGPEQAALVRFLLDGGAVVGASPAREGEIVRVAGPKLSRTYRVRSIALPALPLSCGAAPGVAERFEVREASDAETR